MSKKILIVDDEEDIINVLFARLGSKEFEIDVAFDGPSAIKRASEKIPDLIILDIIMPGMYGSEVAAELRNNPKTANIPIIFLSALKTGAEGGDKGLKVGEHTIFSKPYDFDALCDKINELI